MKIDYYTFEGIMRTDWIHQDPFYAIDQRAIMTIDPSNIDGTTEYFRINNIFREDSWGLLPSAPNDWSISHWPKI